MMSATFTADLQASYKKLRSAFRTKTFSHREHIAQLEALRQSTEQGVILSEIDDSLKHLKSWMKPESMGTSLYNFPRRAQIYREPLGVKLVIGAWNYPLQLTLAPVVGAIAGGNACLIKPPDIAVATSALIHRLVPKYLDQNLFACFEGGKDEVTEILKLPFDLISFTGGTPVAKIVMTAAAQNLTPVVLELGGKSPAVVLKGADLKVAARRIAWGKFMNAGQTCVAPDYVLVEKSVQNELVKELKGAIKSFYGDDVWASPDYCRIVDTRAFDRLADLINSSRVLHGGDTKKDELYIEPTIVEATGSSKVMEGEVFGPVLPVVSISSVDDAIAFINERPKPLALYAFTNDSDVRSRFEFETSSGSIVFNDLVIHMPEPKLPFGGVGNSGMGAYHGKFSFQTFTHAKGVLKKTSRFDVPVRYAPYTPLKARLMRWLLS